MHSFSVYLCNVKQLPALQHRFSSSRSTQSTKQVSFYSSRLLVFALKYIIVRFLSSPVSIRPDETLRRNLPVEEYSRLGLEQNVLAYEKKVLAYSVPSLSCLYVVPCEMMEIPMVLAVTSSWALIARLIF